MPVLNCSHPCFMQRKIYSLIFYVALANQQTKRREEKITTAATAMGKKKGRKKRKENKAQESRIVKRRWNKANKNNDVISVHVRRHTSTLDRRALYNV